MYMRQTGKERAREREGEREREREHVHPYNLKNLAENVY